ncbi:hypothetical protein CHS0354_041150 [Potamilus streckersoni]|uniref:Acid sphingomyelinase-like phosphodiesterase 3a n=1 Tax=Potamilus streckersoni TaxID=2493646 RepID=A0AAE0SEB0_9BIVA|nr:hypothetical protein CHS0354_041150 [Potamilus streckersoni]
MQFHAVGRSKKVQVCQMLLCRDTVLHGKDQDLSLDINSDILKNITFLLKRAFPLKPVFAAYGNHDYWPTDQFPAENNELYNRTLIWWRSWINDAKEEINFLKGGYYSRLIQAAPKIRILSLNTNLYYTSNKQTDSQMDPADQFQWMESVLNSSRVLQEKVIVIAHIPPGVHTPDPVVWMYEKFNNRLNDIFLKYSDVIVAMHFGHDHADGFKVYMDKAGEPVIPVFIAPSVTPWRYKPEHNPAIRLVNYDRQTGIHQDINQYYLNLPEANAQKIATWKLEYTAKQHYGVMDLTPSSLLTLMNKMKDYTSDEFQNYFRWTTVNASSTETCNTDCHVSIICGFSNFDITSYNNCKSKTNGSGSISRKGYLLIPIQVSFGSTIGRSDNQREIHHSSVGKMLL